MYLDKYLDGLDLDGLTVEGKEEVMRTMRFMESDHYERTIRLRNLARAIYDRICKVDLTGDYPDAIDWTAGVGDREHLAAQVEEVRKQLRECQYHSMKYVRDSPPHLPPQPRDSTSISDDISPEVFYQALPTQPPSPTLCRRRRTTIARVRRFRKLLKRKPERDFSSPASKGFETPTPNIIPWPVDWTQLYEDHVRSLRRHIVSYENLPEPNFDNQETEYWQQLSRHYDEVLLRRFFFSATPPATPTDGAYAARKVVTIDARLAPEALELEHDDRRRDGPISSRLRSTYVCDAPISQRFRSKPYSGRQRVEGLGRKGPRKGKSDARKGKRDAR